VSNAITLTLFLVVLTVIMLLTVIMMLTVVMLTVILQSVVEPVVGVMQLLCFWDEVF
jgi:hypothetical protein